MYSKRDKYRKLVQSQKDLCSFVRNSKIKSNKLTIMSIEKEILAKLKYKNLLIILHFRKPEIF